VTLTLLALLFPICAGILSWCLRKVPVAAARIGAAGPILSAFVGLVPVVRVLAGGPSVCAVWDWPMPFGSLAIELDGLSAFFLLPILILSALSAWYGTGYMKSHDLRRSADSWLGYNFLVSSMVLVCLAGNVLLFLVGWETMTLSSFFLVAFDREDEKARKASWMYMVASHLGTAFLLVMFLTLSKVSGMFDFSGFHLDGSGRTAAFCFVLALIGFGTKAGFMPLHVWLPEAHPSAPSHVSALMSGVMIKTGIYGLIRVIGFLGPPPMWWGWTLLAVGAVSGVLGVLFALAQHDLKRLLAYHSVENIGIIALGLGVGLVGLSGGFPAVAALGFSGALFHVFNHAMFKGLLFLGAGSVDRAAHTRDIDRLGGLLRRMPWTGAAFLVGSVAISGLPPLNGFVSEFLIVLGSLRGAVSMNAVPAVSLAAAAASLALIGGLAAACFAKAFGIVFLGEPRTETAAAARENGRSMTLPMAILAGICVATGLFGFLAVRCISPALATGLHLSFGKELSGASFLLERVCMASLSFVALGLLLWMLRRGLLSGRKNGKSETWGCGYPAPSPRMQYTASSFAQPITDLFRFFLRTKKHFRPPDQYFPSSISFETETLDVSRERVYRPLFDAARKALERLRRIQEGRIQVYILYMFLALLALLLWQLR
jgi:formate hydrogenlyase subunit 3/multisubunit Na+/H+ antiporter MnhD subunit